MSPLKIFTAFLIIFCLASANATEFQHDHNMEPIVHFFPSTLEDLDLASSSAFDEDDLDFDKFMAKLRGNSQGGSSRSEDPQPEEKPERKRQSKIEEHEPEPPSKDFDLDEILRRGRGGKDLEPLIAASAAGSPFRIVADYSTINRKELQEPAQFEYISKTLMPAAIDYFTSALKIKYPVKGKLIVSKSIPSKNPCGDIPKIYKTTGVDGDLVVLVKAIYAPNEVFIARAAACITDERTGRAIMSFVEFNTAELKVEGAVDSDRENSVKATMHELVHIFGFTFNLFKNFLLPNGLPNRNVITAGQKGGNTVKYVNVEPLTSKLRKHFGCDKIEGAALENQGGSGSLNSHFERTIFFNELLTGSAMVDARISEFTLAVLEGSGWYVVDYSFAEPLNAGAGQGCNFYFGECQVSKGGQPNFSEFCATDEDRVCSVGAAAGAVCHRDQFSDGCGIPHPEEKSNCKNLDGSKDAMFLHDVQAFGPDAGSKCFMGTLVPPEFNIWNKYTYCFSFKCKGTGASTTLDVTIGKQTAECKKKGSIKVKGYGGELDCPDPVAFCAMTKPYCPRGCLGRGQCKDAKCVCKPGFSGSDCSQNK